MLGKFRVLAAVLVFFSGMMLMSAAAISDAEGNALCVMTMEYTGAIGENQVWVPDTEACTGACATSGDCGVQDQDDADNVRMIECRCPSGGGGDGCRAVSRYSREKAEDPWIHRWFRCEGEESCPTNQECDWFDLGPASPNKRKARCKCQL